MTSHPPNPRRPLAAAMAPAVAAALLAFGGLVAGCGPTPPDASSAPPGSVTAGTPASPTPSTPAGTAPPIVSPSPVVPDGSPPAPGAGRRLVVAVGLPGDAGLLVLALGAEAGPPLELGVPDTLDALTAMATALDGTLAIVGPDGRTWLAPRPSGGPPVRWREVPRSPTMDVLPGQVLGAAWTAAGDRLVVSTGAPGSGDRRLAIAELLLDGSTGRVARVGLEADGPGLAILPDGDVVVVIRDEVDRGRLARVTAPGTASVLPAAARTVAGGGDTIAVADDSSVRVGSLAGFADGVLPRDPLRLAPDLGIGAVAVAPDGEAIAVVRIGDDAVPVRVDAFVRRDGTWVPVGPLALPDRRGGALVAWLPGAP